MAIIDGMSISCGDLQAVGGTRLIAIREWSNLVTVAFDDPTHGINSMLYSGGTLNWGVFESRIESSSLTVSGTSEGKEFTTYECTLSWFVPGMTASQFLRLHEFDGKCLMALVIDNNDATTSDSAAALTYASNKVIGVSNTLPNDDKPSKTQQYARLVSVEGGTGGAFSDEIGVTVTIASTQLEIPRKYEGTIVLGALGTTLTTDV
mgnify:CR=1 FL=1|tara:strand:- start:594 stop:1211 length:618 start_codon:yes stop_codon:yes gene_type:complete